MRYFYYYSDYFESDSHLIILTSLVWPSRWHLSSACLSLYGLKSRSCRMTVLAAVRLMPSPPALVDRMKMKISGSLLKSSIKNCLS